MINEIRLAIADFLNIVIIDNKFIFFNFWHIIHFIFGIIIMFFIFKFYKKTKGKLLILLILLILYEIFEWSVIAMGSTLFKGENKLDVLFDLIIGFAGGVLFVYLEKFWIKNNK